MRKPTGDKVPNHVPYEDNIEPNLIELPDDNDQVQMDGIAVFEKPITDQWIHAELNLLQGKNQWLA